MSLTQVRKHTEFADAVIKAERLSKEEPPTGLPTYTQDYKDLLNDIIDNLEPIQVVGGNLGQGRLDVWFNPQKLAERAPEMGPVTRAALMEILNSVVTEFSPGPEAVQALKFADLDDQIATLNDLFARYGARLIELGAPTPTQLVKRRLGLDG